jgi:L-iditol 2-dehydrogenase
MKAAVWYGPGRENLRLENVPTPVVEQPDDVVIRVHSCIWGAMNVRAVLRGHPELKPPTVMGRLLAGVVTDLGSGVTGLERGARVTVDPEVACGVCFFCKNGEPVHCVAPTRLDPGGLAEYVRVRGRLVGNIFQIPPHLSFDEACYTETLACALWGVLKAKVTFGDTVVVIGCGGLGLTHQQLVRLRGATQVIASDVLPEALEAAAKLGVHVVDSRTEDLVSVVMESTDGRGADAVIEAVGRQDTYETALKLVRAGGTVVAFGGSPPGTFMTVDPNRIHYRSIDFRGSYHYPPGLFKRALDIIAAGTIDLRPVITHSLPLDRIAEAVDLSARPECRLIAIHPNGEASPDGQAEARQYLERTGKHG